MFKALPKNFNPNDGSLIGSTFMLGEGEDAEYAVLALQKWLKIMGLPEPQDSEFVPGKQLRADRLFLNDFGLIFAIRFEKTQWGQFIRKLLPWTRTDQVDPIFAAREIIDDSILQPLVSLPLSKGVVLEIRPGIYPFAGENNVTEQIRKNLKAKGISLKTEVRSDYGTIFHPQTGAQHVVVINRSALSLTCRYNQASGEAPIQNGIFGPLAKVFQKAVNTKKPADFVSAFSMCAHIMQSNTQTKILSSSWGGVAEFRTAGNNYAARLRECGHPALILQAA